MIPTQSDVQRFNVKIAIDFTENKVLKVRLFSRKIIAKVEKPKNIWTRFHVKRRKSDRKAVSRKIADFHLFS